LGLFFSGKQVLSPSETDALLGLELQASPHEYALAQTLKDRLVVECGFVARISDGIELF
jgi:hypothetical protein